ncbi:MAG TPA: glycosyltransferase 87 family protein [Acidobacteriaceae bacterium]|nr:glycosyltransferase 87 family protein [Acidobacteriaceae bacterium]
MTTLGAQTDSAKTRRLLRNLADFLVVFSCALIFGFTAVGILHSLNQPDAPGNRDFVEYWAAARQIVHHANPYDPEALRQLALRVGYPPDKPVVVLPNPPIVLPLIALLGNLSALHSLWLWCSILLCALTASIWMVRKLSGRPPGLINLLAFTFAPGLICLMTGQMSIVILLGLVLFLFLQKKRPFLAGASLAFCALKPHLLIPFAVVLIAWALLGRRFRIFAGAAVSLAAAALVAMVLDLHVWSQYLGMMRSIRVDKAAIPCLSNALRRAIAPDATWLQYAPVALACVWALDYYRRRRETWDWMAHGSLVVLVSVAVAPYSWMMDQVIVLPAILHALYVTRSRLLISVFAVANAAVQLSIFGGGTWMLHSSWLLWMAPFWLAWYLAATWNAKEPSGAAVQIDTHPGLIPQN